MSRLNSKKDHILWAGLEVMKIQGYNGTSVKDIVDAAGVPKGSFYNYFDSKENFAVEALEAAASANFQQMRAQLHDVTVAPMERLKNLFENQINLCCWGYIPSFDVSIL